MQSRERRAQTRQPHHRQHPHELEASEAYAKTPVGVGSLPWNPLDATATSTRGFGGSRRGRALGQRAASTRLRRRQDAPGALEELPGGRASRRRDRGAAGGSCQQSR